jgi:hypothetical protein
VEEKKKSLLLNKPPKASIKLKETSEKLNEGEVKNLSASEMRQNVE